MMLVRGKHIMLDHSFFPPLQCFQTPAVVVRHWKKHFEALKSLAFCPSDTAWIASRHFWCSSGVEKILRVTPVPKVYVCAGNWSFQELPGISCLTEGFQVMTAVQEVLTKASKTSVVKHNHREIATNMSKHGFITCYTWLGVHNVTAGAPIKLPLPSWNLQFAVYAKAGGL